MLDTGSPRSPRPLGSSLQLFGEPVQRGALAEIPIQLTSPAVALRNHALLNPEVMLRFCRGEPKEISVAKRNRFTHGWLDLIRGKNRRSDCLRQASRNTIANLPESIPLGPVETEPVWVTMQPRRFSDRDHPVEDRMNGPWGSVRATI